MKNITPDTVPRKGNGRRRIRKTGKVYLYRDNPHKRYKHFWFLDEWINDGMWTNMPKASKALIPALLSFEQNKTHCPSELYLATMTGLSPQTVREGFNGMTLGGLETASYRTALGHKGKEFTYLNRYEKEDAFPFFDKVISSGSWCQLPMVSKCLYPVMRCHAISMGMDEYEGEIETIESLDNFCGQADWPDNYKERWFDICDTQKKYLCFCAGIHVNSFPEAIRGLIENYLVTESNNGGYLVYLRPHLTFKPAYMNRLVHDKYRRYYAKY